jgi:hypothetical protein
VVDSVEKMGLGWEKKGFGKEKICGNVFGVCKKT